jgi:hypothetical protein
MKAGVILPQGYFDEFDGWDAGRAWERILHTAKLSEQLGFDSLWFGEHVLAKWDRHALIFDFFTIAAGLAAAVPRVAIGFTVVNSTFRNPFLTAKAGATLDAISGGRLVLGLGAGFKPTEAEALGAVYPDIKDRLAILAEHFEIVRRLTRAGEPPFSYEGQSAQVHDVTGAPYGVQQREIPLLIGGHGKNVTFRLAARYCAEINIDLALDDMPDGLRVLKERCEEIGRDPRTVAIGSGTNPAFPYRGLKVTGSQRMMTQADMPSVMDSFDISQLTTRAEEIQRSREMGIDRMCCGAPGLAETDESLYELVEDLEKGGVTLDRGVPGATLAAEGIWVDRLAATAPTLA